METQEIQLIRAAIAGDNGLINSLVSRGTDVNSRRTQDGATALHLAVSHKHYNTVRLLVSRGANVNSVDKDELTPLHYAAQDGLESHVLLLINVLSAVDAIDKDGETPLHLAASFGRLGTVKILLSFGAIYNKMDHSLKTPVDHAQIRGHHHIVRHINAFANQQHQQQIPRPNLGATNEIDSNILLESQSFRDHIQSAVRLRFPSVDPSIKPYNLSLDSWQDDKKMGMFCRYGPKNVASVYYKDGGVHVGYLSGEAPICAGEGRVIYSRGGKVYENGIDLEGPETPLCLGPSSAYEKNWGCFKRTAGRPGDYFIVHSLNPLRIFQVKGSTNCREVPVVSEQNSYDYPNAPRVKPVYPNLEAIERLFIDNRDGPGYWYNTGIFRGATRGIEFGEEYLFVGHVTLHQNGRCFPNWYTQKWHEYMNSNRRLYGKMYFMFFYTISFANDTFSISRMSSCFQPPSKDGPWKIVFPAGIARANDDQIVISYGQNDDDCRVAFYREDEVNAMLAPVDTWHPNNYVFHPHYANSLRGSKPQESSRFSMMFPKKGMGLIATSPVTDKLFNPAITNGPGGKFLTAWRKFDGPNGNVTNWKGYNWVSLESCSLEVKDRKLVYSTLTNPIEFKVGTTTIGGEDPRLIFENNCPLLFINDLDSTRNLRGPGPKHARLMYVHNLNTDEHTHTIHPFCHNISKDFEKNWGPFYVQGDLHFVYSVDPLSVVKVRGNGCPTSKVETVLCEKPSVSQTPANLKEIFVTNDIHMRGGTPGVKLSSDEYLFVGHAVAVVGGDKKCFPDYIIQRNIDKGDDEDAKKYNKQYTAFFYTVKRAWGRFRLNRISCCSHFPGGRENFSKIVFPAGLAKANLGGNFEDAFIVSFGVKDTHGVFCALNRQFLDFVLRPVKHWDTQNYVVDVNYFQNVADLSPTSAMSPLIFG